MTKKNVKEIGTVGGDGLLSELDVSKILRIAPRTLRAWRRRGYGPKHVNLGKFVRYEPQTVQKFIEDSRQTGSGARAA
ncbi:MAG: helix-turn-helix domain-containing protein [Terriglobia bacterium]|jgi:predicted site-specific integrase-resolvase